MPIKYTRRDFREHATHGRPYLNRPTQTTANPEDARKYTTRILIMGLALVILIPFAMARFGNAVRGGEPPPEYADGVITQKKATEDGLFVSVRITNKDDGAVTRVVAIEADGFARIQPGDRVKVKYELEKDGQDMAIHYLYIQEPE